MSLEEWTEKEGIGYWAQARFEQWLSSNGYSAMTIRTEAEWNELWARFVDVVLI